MIDQTTLSMIRDVVAIFGVIAGLTYYVLTVNATRKNQQQQLETRQAQLFMQILNQFNQPSMIESKLFYINLEINSLEDYLKLINDPESSKIMRQWGALAEGIGVLVREKYLDIKVIAGLMGGNVKITWEQQAPYILELREKFNSPRAWIEWEYLYNALIKYSEENPERDIKAVETVRFTDVPDRT